MIKNIKRKIGITSLMFNNIFAMENSKSSYKNIFDTDQFRPDDIVINDINISNYKNINDYDIKGGKDDIYDDMTFDNKTKFISHCSKYKLFYILGGVVLAGTGIGLYFLINHLTNKSEKKLPINPETDIFTYNSDIISTNAETDIFTNIFTDNITEDISSTIHIDGCVDLSSRCSNQEMMNFIKDKFNTANIERCYGLSDKEGLNIVFNNDTNCQVSFYEKPTINILKGYNFNSLNISGTMFENPQGLFDEINANLLDFNNVNFSNVLNFSDFLTNSKINNTYGLNNIEIYNNKTINNFVDNCTLGNLEIVNLTLNNVENVDSVINNTNITGKVIVPNLKIYNVKYINFFSNSEYSNLDLRNVNISEITQYINPFYGRNLNSIDLNHCYLKVIQSNINFPRGFYNSSISNLNMSYCTIRNGGMSGSFNYYIGNIVDFSNSNFYSTSVNLFFSGANINYLYLNNCSFSGYDNIIRGMLGYAAFKYVNLDYSIFHNASSLINTFDSSRLETVSMRYFVTKNLMASSYMFLNTNFTGGNKTIDMYSWDMGRLHNMQLMFSNSNVKKINALNVNLNTTKDSFFCSNSFQNCNDLEEIMFDYNKHTKIKDALPSGFTCQNDNYCNRTLSTNYEYYNNSNIYKKNDTSLLKNNTNNTNYYKNNIKSRDEKFYKKNDEIIDKNKIKIKIDDINITSNPQTGNNNLLLNIRLVISDYIINPFMKMIGLR